MEWRGTRHTPTHFEQRLPDGFRRANNLGLDLRDSDGSLIGTAPRVWWEYRAAALRLIQVGDLFILVGVVVVVVVIFTRQRICFEIGDVDRSASDVFYAGRSRWGQMICKSDG